MFTLKKISPAAISAALAKADKYRLLNEPSQAESICRDVLAVDPQNQPALVTLVLALTDQFDARSQAGVRHAETALAEVKSEYQHTYYDGIIRERWAMALLRDGDPGHQAWEWLREAMRAYEKAEPLAPAGNSDPILRWNSCARVIARKGLSERSEQPSMMEGD